MTTKRETLTVGELRTLLRLASDDTLVYFESDGHTGPCLGVVIPKVSGPVRILGDGDRARRLRLQVASVIPARSRKTRRKGTSN